MTTASVMAAAMAIGLLAAIPGSAAMIGAVPTASPPPSSMLAIGDSFSVGFASGASGCPLGSTPCPAVSWSTGADVNSHYARVFAANPAIEGQQRNAAAPGATMSGFAGQVASGTAGGGVPDYVTVMLGAGDLCFGGPTPVANFVASFRAGMDAVVAVNPSARVLVASVWNLASLRQAALSRDPAAVWPLCGNLLTAATPVSEAVMTRIGEYNAALAEACADYAICRFDDGAFFNHVWTAEEVSTVDNLHPSAAGQGALAELLWNAGYWAPAPAPSPPPSPPSSAPPPSTAPRSDTSAEIVEPVSASPRFTG